MKKLLSLLSVLTISGTAVPTIIAASPYQKEENIISDISYSQTNSNLKNLNRVKRQTQKTVPSLKNIISTVYIGEIQKNNQEQIIQRLREINHPILSRSDFLEHIVFENITWDSVMVHASQNIYADNHAYSIPSSLNFTINFVINRPLLSTIIRNRHLGVVPARAYSLFRLDDSFADYGSILEALRRVNPNLNGVDSNIMQYIQPSYNSITETRLDLTQEGQNFYEQDFVIVDYNDHLSTDFFNSLTPNGILRNNLGELQLGELLDNRSDTILNRIRQLSPRFNINYFVVENITVNSATIRYENNNGDFASFRLDYSFNVTFNLNKNKEQNLNINDNNDSNQNKKQKLDNNNIDKINKIYNYKNSSYCNSTTKTASIIVLSAAGAVAGSIFPVVVTLIGAGIGVLFGGGAGVSVIELACKK